ncbi:MAG: FAD:protein FMN transferase [Planctomycetota bacterium]
MSGKMKPGIVIGIVIVAAVVLLGVLRSGSRLVTAQSGRYIIMGTFARIVAVADDDKIARKCVESARDKLELVNALMSDYDPNSEISKVNKQAYETQVGVSEETFFVLEKALHFSEVSQGAFDVTIGPLVDLWHKAGEANSLPGDAEIAEARSRVGCEKLLLDSQSRTVKFAVEGMRLDLGGIAKGYAIDLAVEAMKRQGAAGGMVEIGGDLRVFGKSPNAGKSWAVGIADPREPGDGIAAGKMLMVLRLNDAAVATSGDYQRFVEVGGERYSHIISPSAASGARGFSSVTVIGKSATDADALATAVSVMGSGEGMSLIEQLEQAEAIVISPAPEYKIQQSSGAGAYLDSR